MRYHEGLSPSENCGKEVRPCAAKNGDVAGMSSPSNEGRQQQPEGKMAELM
jgi:hypothetical protein